MDSQADEIKRKRFRWGIFLAWTPFLILALPTLSGLIIALRAASAQKATGLGAVAGGISEFLLMFGVIAIVVVEVSAIVLLLRALSRGHPLRTLFSVLSLCCSGFMLALVGLFFWLILFRAPHR